ncbi:TMEM165/GDT1 family protein [Aminipila butyrica]|uniref:GDT1 family protein n=1 Tax=Aminipila butyrica TaxID=433296 RepID=A0A858C1E0_9FIRM|nr:TMEM165/GDT1 family protein [Aminipila butyrica]QIB70326.1 TMEM165/GDT1 family protein [Aminipila butyrica]
MGLTALIFSLGAVVLAEMGDKTQLLAMAFATKYKATKVLIGVFVATILNHALAVGVGHLLTRFSAAQVWIQGIAVLSFIFFGLWTIRGDKLEGEENRTTKFGAIATVAIAFFIAEMGDKTQLTTVALATRFPTSPIWILLGTTMGMLIADGIGIIVGVVLCKKIPERKIKLISAAAFIFFGLLGSYQVMRNDLDLNTDIIVLIMTTLYALTAAAAIYLMRKNSATPMEDISALSCPVRKTNQLE